MLPHFLFALYGVPHNIAPRNSRDVGVADVVLEPSGQCVAVVVADVAKKFLHYTAVEFLHRGSYYNVPGLTVVDMRAINRLLRDQGTTALSHLAATGTTRQPCRHQTRTNVGGDLILSWRTSLNLVTVLYVLNPARVASGQVRINLTLWRQDPTSCALSCGGHRSAVTKPGAHSSVVRGAVLPVFRLRGVFLWMFFSLQSLLAFS